jgi:hypothetical protein
VLAPLAVKVAAFPEQTVAALTDKANDELTVTDTVLVLVQVPDFPDKV